MDMDLGVANGSYLARVWHDRSKIGTGHAPGTARHDHPELGPRSARRACTDSFFFNFLIKY